MNFNGCQLHQNKEYKFICLSNHKCLRRLCFECWDEHQQYYPGFICEKIKKFIQKLEQAYSIINLENDHNDWCEDLLSVIMKMHNLQKNQKQIIIRYLNALSNNVQEIDSNYKLLKRILKVKNIEIFTISELEKFIETYLDSGIEIINANQFKKKSINLIYCKVRDFLTKINQNSEIIQNIYKNYVSFAKQEVTQLIGEQYFEMRHGNYYYQLKNSDVLYAGKYLFDEKIGYWEEIENEFKFCGQYKYGKKVGQWKFFLQNILMYVVVIQSSNCQYNSDGQKQGIWQEVIMKQYQKVSGNSMIIFRGQYSKGQRIGFWKICFFKQLLEYQYIGGGKYDENGRKNGIWIDIDENQYRNDKQIFWKGKYEEGLKVGEWQIYLLCDGKNIMIGGGQYENQGKKVGFWKEINEKLFEQNWQNLFQGRYQGGKRIGEWKIGYRNVKSYLNRRGKGQYDQNGQKVGVWEEINEKPFDNKCLIIWKGKYLGGLKVGKWEIFHRYINDQHFSLIGEGFYNNNGKKDGIWKDIAELFSEQCLVIEQGQYHNGVKCGEWIQLTEQYSFVFNSSKAYQIIGKGHYDCDGHKNGFWKDIIFSHGSMLHYWEGQYQQGLKVGEWKLFRDFCCSKHVNYDKNGLKTGRWEDEDDRFGLTVIQQCDNPLLKGYENQGMEKTFQYRFEFGVSTNEEAMMKMDQKLEPGMKLIRVISQFFEQAQISLHYKGNYFQGLKVGQWKTYYQKDSMCFSIIGGGKYDQNGKKIGLWNDVDIPLFLAFQIVFEGHYTEGLRIGVWKILKRKKSNPNIYKIVGGGYYDQTGQKQGIWKEYENYEDYNVSIEQEQKFKIVCNGLYEKGLRAGQWILCVKHLTEQGYFKLGGQYNGMGQKIGEWIEIKKVRKNKPYMCLKQGTYQEGIKIGEWIEYEYYGDRTMQQLQVSHNKKPSNIQLHRGNL